MICYVVLGGQESAFFSFPQKTYKNLHNAMSRYACDFIESTAHIIFFFVELICGGRSTHSFWLKWHYIYNVLIFFSFNFFFEFTKYDEKAQKKMKEDLKWISIWLEMYWNIIWNYLLFIEKELVFETSWESDLLVFQCLLFSEDESWNSCLLKYQKKIKYSNSLEMFSINCITVII